MSKLELILLGRFECLLSTGTRVSLAMRKAEVLLAFLALAPGLRHPRERLVNLLWSERGEDQARNSLRQCLSAIRKSLGDAADLALQIDRSSVCLNPELVEVDAHEFERLAENGDYESLLTAADLYQGEFLEGIAIRDAACQEWLDSERDRFKRQFIEILHKLAETQLVSHDYANAIRSAERLVEQDPLAESGWRLLMQSYAAKGDRSHALQAFKRCRQVLQKELEIEPETATVELRERIAGGESRPAPAAPKSVARTPGDERSIVVLPFDNLSGDPEQEYFSDGITESIIMNLALFPGLHVKSRNSSFAFKQQLMGLAEISRELDVDYVVEGSVRKSKERIRITAQLIDAANGNQLWGKRYDAEIDDLFVLEENLSREIAATVTGRIASELQRIAIAKGAADQQAYDLLLAGMYHVSRFNSADNAIAIEKFERCLAQDPDNVRAHVGLYICYNMAYLGRWFENRKDSFDKSWDYIRRATRLDPEDRAVQVFLAEMLGFNGELDKAKQQIDKVLAQNPNDTDALAVLATIYSFLGDTGNALKTAENALQLDPFHPWAEWELAVARYYCLDYAGTLDAISAMRTAPPGFINLYEVAALVRLERMDEARAALKEFMRECESSMKEIPRDIDEWTEYTRENYLFVDMQRNHDLVDTLLQAGLEQFLRGEHSQAASRSLPSLLVLPFANQSGDPQQEYFSDGITESIIMNLAASPGLQVKSRHASFAFKDSARAVEEIAAELGVRYIVAGSIRKAGDKVRISAQLSETGSGNQIWGKRFDYDLADLFALEEDLSMTIAGSISTRVGKEARLSALRKPAKDLQSYDYYMRGSYYLELFTADNIGLAMELFEKCLSLDPDNSLAHAKLGIAHMVSLYENCSRDRERSLQLMDAHLCRALELDPDDAEAHAFMAEMLMYRRDFDRALVHARKAVELNPTLADGYSMLAWHAGAVGKLDEARAWAEKSMQTDIHHPYAGWNAGEIYRLCGDYELAIETFRSMAHMSTSVRAQVAACLAGLNRLDEARSEMRRYLELAREQMTSMPSSQQEWYDFWWESMPYKQKADNDRYFELLLQAGLCDRPDDSADTKS